MAIRIDDFVIRIGAMTPKQVETVLNLQEKTNGQQFGEIALALGYLKDDSLKRFLDYLEKQN